MKKNIYCLKLKKILFHAIFRLLFKYSIIRSKSEYRTDPNRSCPPLEDFLSEATRTPSQ